MNTVSKLSRFGIPGPKGHFLLGSLPDIQRDRVQFLVDLQRQYGDVVRIWLGPVEAMAVFHPDAIKRIMQDNQSNYSKDTIAFRSMRNIFGNGLIVSNGDFWLRQRRLMQPAFHHDRINALTGMIVQQTQTMLDSLASSARNGQTVNFWHDIMNLTLGIATQSLFGKHVQDADGKLGEMIGHLARDTTFRFEHPWYPPLWFPSRRNRQLTSALKFIDTIIYEMVAERRKHPRQMNNLLDMMMETQLEESEFMGGEPRMMTDRQLRDETITLMLAGHETTSAHLCWALYLLSKHPDVEVRLRHELDTVLNGHTPRFEDLPRLEYTRMIRDEVLRLYPPVWLTERTPLKEDQLCGYCIPPGITLAITQYVTHRHPDFWKDPETFDPERFNTENSKGRHEYAYFPFSGGRRQCLGKNLALLESQLILAMFIQRYRFELEPGWQVLKEPELSLRTKGGLFIRLKPA